MIARPTPVPAMTTLARSIASRPATPTTRPSSRTSADQPPGPSAVVSDATCMPSRIPLSQPNPPGSTAVTRVPPASTDTPASTTAVSATATAWSEAARVTARARAAQVRILTRRNPVRA